MTDDRHIDWREVSDARASSASVERLKRVVDFFDGLNFRRHTEAEAPETWCGLTVHEALASGSFGTVYRAYDNHLRREVALKLMPAAAASEAWLEEARRLARVRHPGVIAILGADRDEHHAGIWMELSNGRTLDCYLRENANSADWIAIAESVADALAAVHARQLVHGDVKPNNILVEPSGRVLLLDFGAATMEGESAYQASPKTAAPEVLATGDSGPASDIWSLGILLARGVQGQFPFEAISTEELVVRQRSAPMLSGVPRSLRGLLLRMLALEPDRRPKAETVVQELRWIAGAPARRRRTLAITAVLSTLVVGLAVAAAGWYDAAQANVREQLARERAEGALDVFQNTVGAVFRGTHGANARVMDVLQRAEEVSSTRADLPSSVRAMVDYVTGSSYLSVGNREEGLSLLDRSLTLLRTAEPMDVEAVGLVLVQQGLEICQGDADGARTIADEIYRLTADVLPANHRIPVAALKIEACAASRAGDQALAVQKLLKAIRSRPPQDHPGDIAALGSLGRLAAIYVDQGRIGEAEPLIEQAHAGMLKHAGPDNSSTISMASTLGAVYIEQSRFEEAMQLLSTTLARIEVRNGRDSNQWIIMANTLATAMARAGLPESALELTDQVIDAATTRLGEDHSFTLTARTNRAIRIKELGQLENARVAMTEVIETTRQSVGLSHPLTLLNQVNLTEVLLMTDRTDEAVRMGEETLAAAVESLGREHGITNGARAYLARALAAAGERVRADALFREAIAIADKDSPTSDLTFRLHLYHADLLVMSGHDAEARTQLAGIMGRVRESLGATHELVAMFEERLESIP